MARGLHPVPAWLGFTLILTIPLEVEEWVRAPLGNILLLQICLCDLKSQATNLSECRVAGVTSCSQIKSQWALESLRVNFRSPFSFRLCLPTSSIIYGVADKPKMGYIRPRESLPLWADLSLEGSVGLVGNEGGSQEFSLGKVEIYVQTSY